MSKLTIVKSSYAPGRFILCQVWGCPGNWQWDETDSDKSCLVGESDIPCIASLFGWSPCDKCRETDGTIACDHKTADVMRREAYEHLDNECAGMVVEDPGIFGNLPEGF